MRRHGGYEPTTISRRPDFALWTAVSTPGSASGFRNLFGQLGPHEAFEGYGPGHVDKTEKLMLSLAQRMNQPDNSLPKDNPRIPSGYTYLAQLVAHDISFLGSSAIATAGSAFSNLRIVELNLDTVFGAGPFDRPAAYSVPEIAGAPRVALRLGLLPKNQKGEYPTDPSERRKYARDLPRITCPNLSDPVHSGPPTSSPLLTDVLIADPRNDDNPIVGQTLVLFHLLYNAVCAKLLVDNTGTSHPERGAEIFSKARRITTFVYRRIVAFDLLKRLLCCDVYNRYTQNEDPFIDRSTDSAIPVEFSHAAYRIGHAMVRPGYRFQADPDSLFGLRDVLQMNSASRPGRMPLPRSWIIQWSRFYEVDGTPDNLSRRIGPTMVPTLSDGKLFGGVDSLCQGLPNPEACGGLAHRDLLRGASVPLRSVNSLIDKLPADLKRKSELLHDPATRASRIRDWLTAGGQTRFSDEDLDVLSRDPPLLFFVLFEAAKTEDGLRLGILGSVILAEVFFRAYTIAAAGANGAAFLPVTLPDENPEASEFFAGQVPDSMPELIRFLSGQYDFEPEQCPFV